MSNTPNAGAPDRPSFDWRTLLIMLAAALIGAAWSYYNFTSTGGERGEAQLQPLVWAIFGTPFALFLGWVIARHRELWLAAFACFCVYFYTPFIGARIESFLVDAEQARSNGHIYYFQAVIIVHLLSALGLAIWRARTPATLPSPAAAPSQTDTTSSEQPLEGAPDAR